MHRILLSTLISSQLWIACDAPSQCAGHSGPCVVPGVDVQERAQNVLSNARFGDVIYFPPGVYEFKDSLELAVHGVTIRGSGMDQTIFRFSDVPAERPGIITHGSEFSTIEDLAVEETSHAGIQLRGGNNLTIRRVRIEWTEPSEFSAAGLLAYGVENLLVEDSTFIGATVEGVDCAHSHNVVIHSNHFRESTVGVHVKNSSTVDVHDNTVTNNAVGVVVSNMPDDPEEPPHADELVTNGESIRVYANEIHGNNGQNHARGGNVLWYAPSGIGVLILTGRRVEIFDNIIEDHRTLNMGILSFKLLIDMLNMTIPDPDYEPYTHTIHAHDNDFGCAGYDVDDGIFGSLIRDCNERSSVESTPDIVFDGYVDPELAMSASELDQFQGAYNLCFHGNDSSCTRRAQPFVNCMIPAGLETPNLDLSRHDCEHPPLPPVSSETGR